MQNNLTLHEIMVLRALANGAQSKEIAEHINRSRGTVEFYIRGLFAKLNARSRPHLVAQAFRTGLLTVEQSGSATVTARREREIALKRIVRAATVTRVISAVQQGGETFRRISERRLDPAFPDNAHRARLVSLQKPNDKA